jgi:hypothetical protein
VARILALVTVVATAVLLYALPGVAAKPPSGGPGLLPDLRTVVPLQLQIQNAGQQEILRFSNGIANTGAGPWALRPDPPPGGTNTETTAVQEIRDSGALWNCSDPAKPKQVTACHNVVSESVAGTFTYHPEHNHWHIGDVALFEIRKGSPTGPVVGNNSLKVTFCLIDWYKLDGNSPTGEKVFWDCATSYQGISSGWVDQYHQSTEGQQLDITGIPNADDYYLVSTANHEGTYLESNYTNNTAWVKFRLYQTSNGNRKVEVVGNSPCDTPGLCGVGAPNR